MQKGGASGDLANFADDTMTMLTTMGGGAFIKQSASKFPTMWNGRVPSGMEGSITGEYVQKGLREISKENTPKGLKIAGYTRHGLNQAIGRDYGIGVHPSSILDALNNPISTIEQAKDAVKYVASEATVVLNQDGKIITLYGKPRGPQIWNKSEIITN